MRTDQRFGLVFRAKTNRVSRMTIKTAAARPAAAAMSNFNRSSIMMFSPSGKVLGLAGAAPLTQVVRGLAQRCCCAARDGSIPQWLRVRQVVPLSFEIGFLKNEPVNKFAS
jgi:hypothetical protein